MSKVTPEIQTSIIFVSTHYGNNFCTNFQPTGVFPVFCEHDPNACNREFQQCFVKNWEKLHHCNFAMI